MRLARIKGTIAKLALFAVISTLASIIVFSTLRNSVSGPARHFDAIFTDASGLRAGDDVRMAGVKVGRVDSVARDGIDARVGFTVLAGQPVYTVTTVDIRYQNLIGQRYLALQLTERGGKLLSDGATIPLTRTKPSLNLSALFDGFAPLFNALNPADFNALSSNLIQALQGSGPALAATLAQITQLSQTLSSRDEIIGRVIGNLSNTLQNLAAQGPQFDSTLKQAQQLVSGLTATAPLLFQTFATAAQLGAHANALLSAAAPTLHSDLTGFNAVAQTYLADSPELAAIFQRLPEFLGSLGTVLSYGSWANIYICHGVVEIPGGVNILPTVPPSHSAVCR